MIHTIIVRAEESLDNGSYSNVFQKKYYEWIEGEFDKGNITEVLNLVFSSNDTDNSVKWELEYRAEQDPIHLELLERLKIGL